MKGLKENTVFPTEQGRAEEHRLVRFSPTPFGPRMVSIDWTLLEPCRGIPPSSPTCQDFHILSKWSPQRDPIGRTRTLGSTHTRRAGCKERPALDPLFPHVSDDPAFFSGLSGGWPHGVLGFSTLVKLVSITLKRTHEVHGLGLRATAHSVWSKKISAALARRGTSSSGGSSSVTK